MHWLYLLLAILCEVAGITAMKLSHGLTKLIPTLSIVAFYVLAGGFITLSLKRLDIGVAYAIWAGLGTTLIALVGIYWFNEPVNAVKIISIILVVLGIIGLSLTGVTRG